MWRRWQKSRRQRQTTALNHRISRGSIETAIDHTRTKARSPQTNGIVERFHKTMLDEFYRIAFRKKVYATIDELQADLDLWMNEFNEIRPHQGKWCFGKTPMKTFIDALPLAREKSGQLQAIEETHAA